MFALENVSFERLPLDDGQVKITFRTTDWKEAYAMWKHFSQFFGQTFDPYSMHRQQDNQPSQIGQQAAIGHTPQLMDERGQV